MQLQLAKPCVDISAASNTVSEPCDTTNACIHIVVESGVGVRCPTDASVSGWVGPPIQLQLGLHILRGEGDTDLYASCDTACKGERAREWLCLSVHMVGRSVLERSIITAIFHWLAALRH